MTDAVVLVAHGSRLAGPRRAFRDLAARLDARLPGRRVAAAFLESGEPDLAAAIAAAVADGAARVLVVPHFLHRGAHVRRDLPALVAAARAAHPGTAIELDGCLEGDPALEELLLRRLAPHA